MTPNSKIATCCYCGTRAALVLRGEGRHELSCSACGAPLHDLKMMPQEKARQPKMVKKTSKSQYGGVAYKKKHKSKPSKKPKKRKGFMERMFDEAWDAIEDVFD